MTRSLDPEISRMGREKRTQIADKFARQTIEIVNKLKAEEEISSYRDTLKMLNDKNVPTYSGGKWQMSTLCNLYKRCKKLDL